MDLSGHDQKRCNRWLGIMIVVLLHLAVFYALVDGLGKQIISVINPLPIETQLITETKPPAPPAPVVLPTPPKLVTPSTPLMPTPEVAQPSSTPDAIQAETAIQPLPPVQESTGTESVKAPLVVAAVADFSTCAKPDYPRNALRNEEQGTVRIQFLIGLDGRVADARIEKSSGFRTLDAAAKNALDLCTFKPGMVNGIPQQSWVTVDYVWKLPD